MATRPLLSSIGGGGEDEGDGGGGLVSSSSIDEIASKLNIRSVYRKNDDDVAQAAAYAAYTRYATSPSPHPSIDPIHFHSCIHTTCSISVYTNDFFVDDIMTTTKR
jgi:hypothetical protein